MTYKQYPIYNSTSAFFDVLALQAPVLIFNRFFSETLVGFYSLTVRVIALPVSIISNAVAQVYLSELADKEHKGERIDFLLKKALKLLATIGIFPLVVLFVIGPWLFEIVFGDAWQEAGNLAQILAFSYYAKFVVSPLSVVFFVKNAIKLLSIIQFGRAISTLLTLLICSIFISDFKEVILIYAIHEVFFYSIYLICIFKIVR